MRSKPYDVREVCHTDGTPRLILEPVKYTRRKCLVFFVLVNLNLNVHVCVCVRG